MRPLMYKVISVRRVKYDRVEDEILKSFGVPVSLDDSYDSRDSIDSRDSRDSRISDVSFESTGTTRSQLKGQKAFLSLSIRQLESELTETVAKIDRLEYQLQMKSHSLTSSEGAKNGLVGEVDRLRSINLKLLETNLQLESDNSRLTSDLGRLRDRMQAIILEKSKVATSAQDKSLALEFKILTESNDMLKQKRSDLETNLERMAQENATLKSKMKTQDERYAKHTSSSEFEKRQLVAKLEKSDRLVVDQSQFIGHLQGQIRDLAAFLSSERDDVRGLKDTLWHVRDDLKSLKKTKPFYTALIQSIESHLNDEVPPVSASSTLARENAYAPSSAAARRPLPPPPSHDYEELSPYQRTHRAQ